MKIKGSWDRLLRWLHLVETDDQVIERVQNYVRLRRQIRRFAFWYVGGLFAVFVVLGVFMVMVAEMSNSEDPPLIAAIPRLTPTMVGFGMGMFGGFVWSFVFGQLIMMTASAFFFDRVNRLVIRYHEQLSKIADH